MLAIQKNNEVNQKLIKALERLRSLDLAKQTFFTYVIRMNGLQKTNAKKIWNSMTEFEQKIVKLTFYSSQKVKRILNFTKIYREFSHHWQRISKVNIKNLQQLSNDQIETSQKIVRQKAQLFFQELKQYTSEEKSYKIVYEIYKNMCFDLKSDIEKIKSYADPLCFYNQKFTSKFLQKLKKKFEDCNVEQTKLKTQTQMLDQKRLYLSQNLSQVKEAYVPTFEKILKTLYVGIKYIIDPSKDETIQKEDFKLKKNDLEDERNFTGEVQNLLSSQANNEVQQDDEKLNLFEDFKQLFQNNEIVKSQITSDQKFFYDRCQSIKSKKIKRSNQILCIQKLLINELKIQIQNLKLFQNESKRIEKQIFGSDGAQTFSKKFRKYFGKNFHELYQLCMLITEKRKSSIEKIYKVIQSCEQKLSSTFKQKKQKLKFFQNRTNFTLQSHKKIKDKVQSNPYSSNQLIKQYKNNVLSTYEDFYKNYKDLQNYEGQMDKMFFKGLQQISDLILKQAINKSLTKIIQKQKNRVEIFKQLKLTTEAQTNFYQDVKYEIFFSEQIQPNLNKNFKSQINTKQFQQTKNTLLQKQYTLNGMIKHKITCCGVKSEPLTKNVKQSFQCYLVNMKKNKSKIFGGLNILSNGINFSQKSLNPFSNLLQIILPSKDIDSYKTQVIEETSVLTIGTKKGPVYFYGNEISAIYESMLKNIGLKLLQKQSSQKNGRNQSSCSSFLGNTGSQSFRIQFQKSTSSSINKLENMASPTKVLTKKQTIKKNTQGFTSGELLQKLQLKLMSNQFLSENFVMIEKQMPIKDDSRFNYNYKNGHHKFLLKQKKRSSRDKKVLSFDYSWKVSFPQNVMLKSFKHYQTVYVQIDKTQVKIKIIHGVNMKNVSLAQKIFYDQISAMNDKLTAFIVNFTQRQGDIVIEPDNDESVQSQFNIDPDDIVVNFDRQSSAIKNTHLTSGQNFFKNNKLQKLEKSSSNFTIVSSNNNN